jgi:hypothetical protein
MKSSILAASYLWKDTCKRWFEQPGSPLARVFVTGLLAFTAAMILVTFDLLERSIRERLERFGLNTVVVRETITSDSRELTVFGQAADHLAALSTQGERMRLRQLFVRGSTEWQSSLVVFTYPPQAFADLAPFMSRETPLICFSENLPAGAHVRVAVNRQSKMAVIRRPQGWLRPLLSEDTLLAPQGTWAEEERIGYIATTVLQRAAEALPVSQLVSAVNNLYAMERRAPPQVQSALPLINELETLRQRQTQWRNLLAGILGLAVSLVYGSISFLEFRQNLFVSALLRSFGAPSRWLFSRHLAENVFLANMAAVCAIMTVVLLHKTIFGTLGFTSSALDFANPYASAELFSILLWVNAGALLSSIPILVGLRRPVGATLN